MPSGSIAYLPYTLPGEHVRTGPLTRRGEGWTGSAEILTSSPERVAPPCPHFGDCGGCTLQHWQDAPYAAWKTAQVQAALTRAGFTDVPVTPLARTPCNDRRRVDLGLSRTGNAVLVGLHRHRAADIVDLQTCLVLEPRLVVLIGGLRGVLPRIAALRRTGSAVANLVESGIDLLLRTDAVLTAADRSVLSGWAPQAGVCRVSWALRDGPPEPACQLQPAAGTFAGTRVNVPPGAFLQASRTGQAVITQAVLAGLPAISSRGRIVELYAGCGTLTFPLAQRGRVVAYEGDPAAHAALRQAASGQRVEAVLRDLARQPLQAKEIAGAEAVVLDPPFAGAAGQMAAVAASGVARVIYVSCNPAALARDARALHGAGYRAASATPVDQFLWSASVESIILFDRRPVRHRMA